MSSIPHLVGMVHLLPLPGSPGFDGSLGDVVERAVTDAMALQAAGFPALMVENFGDTPFFGDNVPPVTVAAMTVAVVAVRDATGLPTGVNVLRNDAGAALGIAAATGAEFIRVNVLTGLMYTDQGPIAGRAAEVIRLRAQLCPATEVWADVMVKHATPPPGAGIGQMAADTVGRAHADAIIVSGSDTGAPPDTDELAVVRSAVPAGTRLVVGSGANVENLSSLAAVASTVIVGSAVKTGGVARNGVDSLRASELVQAAKDVGLL